MAIYWGNNPSGAPAIPYEVGDIFIGTIAGANLHTQRRYNGTSWEWIKAPEGQPTTTPAITQARGDSVPSGGVLNDRLAKGHANPWNLVWRNAAEGVVFTYERASGDAAEQWIITHNLSARIVDVEVVSPGNANPTAEQTVIVPEVTFVNTVQCSLRFVEPVFGTAVIRR